jgi:hypothetical protein
MVPGLEIHGADGNIDAVIECLPGCVSADKPAR